MPSRGKQRVRLRAARYAGTGRGDHRGHASDNGPRPPARYGQNDRAIATARKNALFAGSDAGARAWASFTSLIQTARLNGIDPFAYLKDVLERIVSGRIKTHQLDRLLPWAWNAEQLASAN